MTTRIPIPLEKYDSIPEMGRFTLRDESRTIALGKVLKYKPAKVTLYEETKIAAGQTVGKEETKKPETSKEIIFNMETGETTTKEEKLHGKMGAINEDEEDEDDEHSPGVT